MKWAIEKAPPMPAQLVATLTGLAYHADGKGAGAFPSLARLAAYTCKSERSVRRDLRDLEDLKLIRRGDQSKAAHIAADKRPTVYDLAVELTVPKGRAGDDEGTRTSARTLTSSRARGIETRRANRARSEDVSEAERPDVDVRGDADVRADVDVTATGRGRHSGGTSTSAEPKEEPKEEPSSPPVGGHARHDEREQDSDGERIPDPFAYIQPLIKAMAAAGFTSLSWQMGRDDLYTVARVLSRTGAKTMVDFAVSAKATSRVPIGYATFFLRGWLGLPPKSAQPAAPAEKPPWCGHLDCDEITRTREVETPTGHFVLVPCPDCHPNRKKAA